MLIALLADIHANDLAFEACLAKARQLGAARLVILGDLVGYGAEPGKVVRHVMALAKDGAIAVLGNHDQAVSSGGGSMNDHARRAIEWTARELGAEEKSFLAKLPLMASDGNLLFVHAEASAPGRWNYVRGWNEARRSLISTSASVTFCGHTHVPALYCSAPAGRPVFHSPVTGAEVPLGVSRQWLAVIGSVGQPRDGNPAASFATYDTLSRHLTYQRAPYDAEAAAAKIRAAGLPAVLADRLLEGR